jgi:hypothetical protein
VIIRPKCRQRFVTLPNSLLNDRRLSADTRAMLALLLSKPPSWELQTKPLRKLLSREGDKHIGWTKLSRMIAEATTAGYMSRSQKQTRNDDGTWGKYDYFVGMPDDVLQAIQTANVAVAPHSHDPYKAAPPAENEQNRYKEQNLERTEFKKGAQASFTRSGTPSGFRAHAGKRQEVVQHQVAVQLGRGDAEQGWLIFGSLSDSRRDALTALARSGRLTEAELSIARATAFVEIESTDT